MDDRRPLCPHPQGVLDRFSQIQPKLIFSVEAVVYNGKEHAHLDKLQQVVRGGWPPRPGRPGHAEACARCQPHKHTDGQMDGRADTPGVARPQEP